MTDLLSMPLWPSFFEGLPQYQHPIRMRWTIPPSLPVLYLDGLGGISRTPPRRRPKRASKGWRKHVRRMKAAERRAA